ncbi:MAG TPA: long-chain fatty acid--CoA ligase [Deltaproteobacteria bacterium]|nr:long-chain fatty acid--CoA ligase [Deltaproteobacteria bacterium]HPA74203.1 long-chain fatty acid--CoA ligase [Deltaproteobacteria bacterium]HPH51708.1 long-chain fatty acid--CoA ligase [Deltaproteobacteria bacterium]HPJ06965.1 long-chain fatty acid--CoA ligase [Deltaproteobacteria bacterium]HQO59420.1 long-chain fatty acid--CoA ligase [Deltaproteobacteria bacterium]
MAKYKETSMGAIFQNRVEEYGDKTLVIWKNQGKWEEISWNKMNEMVRDLGLFLIARGIQPGDKVCLFSPNRYEWWVADLAIISVGAVNVPIYATNSAEESRYIIENSDAKMCFVGTKEHMSKILEVKPKLPNLGDVILFDVMDKLPAGVVALKDAYKEGKAYKNKDDFDKRIIPINIEDVATIIYTSGTTGNPKGVMLTHKNFVSNVNQANAVDPDFLSGDHTFLSFLPLAHSLERTVGYYAPIFLGKKVAFAESTEKLLENLNEIRPTFLVSVPRIYEKVHSGITSKVATAPPVKKALFNWAMGIAAQNLPYICNDRPKTGFFAFKFNLANKIIFSKLRAALGLDRLVAAISGGGPLSVSDAEFFLGMGIKVLEGFGLTETTPITNANKPKLIKPGTVGPAVKDTIVKISEDGEVLIKGPQVMKGYYKNEAATKEAFTEDGFFRTGDIGEIDKDGYLKITGRIKDLIVTSGGKNISPQNIENTLVTSKFIEQVAIIGDNRKYLSALIVPSYATLEAWAKENNIAFTGRKDLISKPEVQKLYEKELEDHMKDYARVEQIRKFTLLETEWSQDTGEMTPTMKVKRKVINQKYGPIIEAMYPPE